MAIVNAGYLYNNIKHTLNDKKIKNTLWWKKMNASREIESWVKNLICKYVNLDEKEIMNLLQQQQKKYWQVAAKEISILGELKDSFGIYKSQYSLMHGVCSVSDVPLRWFLP